MSNVWLFAPAVPVVRLTTGNVPAGEPDGFTTFVASESEASSSPSCDVWLAVVSIRPKSGPPEL
jgi:hypothetical protein